MGNTTEVRQTLLRFLDDRVFLSAKWWPLLALVTFATATGLSQSGAGTASSSYAPAYYHGSQGEPPEVVVFPPSGGRVVIPLPSPDLLRTLAFTPDGRAIFATIHTIISPRTSDHPARLGPPRMIRVELSPVRVTTVADLVGLDDVFGLVAVPHQDKVLFTGSGWKGNLGCELFEIEPSSGDFKMLLPHVGCGIGGISPDGGKMLVPRGLGLSILDLGTRSFVPLASGLPLGSVLGQGAWSPDGRWIAALQTDPANEQARSRRTRTIRIDAHDFAQRRDLGGEGDVNITWSPDSRYLLYNEGPTLLTMDIESGKRVIVKGAKGVYGGPNIGWVSLDVLTEGGSNPPSKN